MGLIEEQRRIAREISLLVLKGIMADVFTKPILELLGKQNESKKTD